MNPFLLPEAYTEAQKKKVSVRKKRDVHAHAHTQAYFNKI
jgi:hypothetical protein